MSKKPVTNLDAEKKLTKNEATKKFQSTSLDSLGRSKETSKIQSSENAAVENHYVNGSFPHTPSNRGK